MKISVQFNELVHTSAGEEFFNLVAIVKKPTSNDNIEFVLATDLDEDQLNEQKEELQNALIKNLTFLNNHVEISMGRRIKV